MRTFLAVSPPPELARALIAARTSLSEAWSGVRWVKPENLHITLVFLGERDPSLVDAVRELCGAALPEQRAFDVGFAGPGCFGDPARPKLFYEAVGVGADRLTGLVEALRPLLEPLIGWERRPYRPHLTLGRPRRRGCDGPPGGGLLPPGRKSDTVGAFRAREVVLYESRLEPDGARYDRLAGWPLKEAS